MNHIRRFCKGAKILLIGASIAPLIVIAAGVIAWMVVCHPLIALIVAFIVASYIIGS